MQMSKFQVFQGCNRKFYFRMKSAEQETLFVSNGFRTKAGAMRGIASLMHHARYQTSYYRRLNSNYKYYFVLKSRDGLVLGTSQLYDTRSEREKGMESVKQASQTCRVDDLT